jgi:trehalose 6-phosphate phosphatase
MTRAGSSNAVELLGNEAAFEDALDGRRPAVFLDYDGTLTPIVERPEDAKLSDEMRAVVRDLAGELTVAVVSGRDRRDVQRLVKIDELVYAGSHGFDIRGPEGMAIEHEVGRDVGPELDEAERELHELTDSIEGAQIERKTYSIAVHYRRVAEGDQADVESAVDRVLERVEGLRKSSGKKVWEVQPDLDWHKGKAVLWLCEALGVDTRASAPVYIGDDVTDEDAFREIEAGETPLGVGIVVDETERETAARFRLRDVGEVQRFLEWMTRRYGSERA